MKWATTSARLAGGRSGKTPNCSKLCSRTTFLVNTLNLYRDDCPAWNFFRLICKGWNYAKHRLETVTARWAFAPKKYIIIKRRKIMEKAVCVYFLSISSWMSVHTCAVNAWIHFLPLHINKLRSISCQELLTAWSSGAEKHLLIIGEMFADSPFEGFEMKSGVIYFSVTVKCNV